MLNIIIREVQIMSYHFTSVKIAIIKKKTQKIVSIGNAVEKFKLLYTVGM